MMIDEIENDLYAFLLEIEELGFSLCLVGGSVRDYLLNKTISRDLDFEIRAHHKISLEEWQNKYQSFIKFLEEKQCKFTKLPYLITRVNFNDHSLEFSSPRIEKFIDKSNNSHHNFETELSSNLDYKASFKRRDFTINAIGFEFNFKNKSEILIDPYDGVIDLKNKMLNHITDDFYFDPVRFIRLLRFKSILNFSLSTKLTSGLSKFNLLELSDFHFINEFFKSNKEMFLNDFKISLKQYNLSVPTRYQYWINNKLDFSKVQIENISELIIATVFLDEGNSDFLLLFFGQQKNEIEEYQRIQIASKCLINIKKADISESLKDGNIVFQKTKLYSAIKTINDKKEKIVKIQKIIPEFFPINSLSSKEWNSVVMTNAELLSYPENERSSIRYYLSLKKWIDCA